MTKVTAPVSVIIPCFLCKDTIERAVLSVLMQTMLPREILLVDDASPDEGATLDELNKIAREHGSQIAIRVVLSAENRGPGSARNQGWKLACQPYIAFLDADDVWFPHKVELQYKWMQAHPEFFLTCHQQVLLNDGASFFQMKSITNREDHHEILDKELLYFNLIPTRTVMLRRELPYRFQEGKRYSEDYLLWLTIVLSGVRAAKIKSIQAAVFKPDFGVAGLSARLIDMEIGELDCYFKIYSSNLIGIRIFLQAVVFSLIKFIRRIFLTSTRKYIF